MALQARALTFKRQKEQSAAVRLLHADNAPVVLAMIAEYFPRGAEPRPAGEVYELMASDFALLRDTFDLPKSPQSYCNDWVKAGWLVRKSGTQVTGETLEPSEDGLVALQMMDRVGGPYSAVTASRVASISNALQDLARDTDPDISTRLKHLRRQRDRVDEMIADVERGVFELPSDASVQERVGDILGMASAIPSDFARVRHQLEVLNLDLRRQLLDPEGSRGDVLAEIFAGVDVISESDAGRSFNGFYRLVVDAEHGAWVESWIGEILQRVGPEVMDSKTRSQFRNLFRNLEDAGYEVNRMMTRLARNLRNYVSSEQFAEDRRMIELLRDTRRLAAEAAEAEELSPTKRMETPLQRIGMAVSSVAQMKLADPGAEVITSDVKRFEASEGDAEALLELVRESEIDLEELSAAVADAVAELGKPSIADVLEHHPATQGLASVVGLVYLAMRFGVQLDGRESVRFEEDDGAVRLATLPLFTFDTTSVEEMR
ncbi:DUF3375 domain-containing protein [Corynebacterium riegelii]